MGLMVMMLCEWLEWWVVFWGLVVDMVWVERLSLVKVMFYSRCSGSSV